MRSYISRQKSATLVGGSAFESFDGLRIKIIGQAAQRFFVPFREHAFQIKRRIFALNLVGERKVHLARRARIVVAQNGFGFARVVIAIVIEEDDFAADFALQTPRRVKLGH